MRRHQISYLLLMFGALLLAISPAQWLWRSWNDANWNSSGALIAALVTLLFVWSLCSPRRSRNPVDRRTALLLLGVSTLTRLAGQVLGVNMIGALALAVDVYALGLLGGLEQRDRAVSPAWLALLFVLALPFERVIQRVAGFALQQVSAVGACSLLSLGPGEVSCEGIRILIDGIDVLVDLPCSGARGLLQLLAVFATIAALRRPSWPQAVLGLLVVGAAALLLNLSRISLLAVLLAWPPFGIDVMAAPWHEAIGLLCLSVALVPLLFWASRLRQLASDPNWVASVYRSRITTAPGVLSALAFVGLACAVVSVPATPFDISRVPARIDLPAMLAGYPIRPEQLLSEEQAYYTQYGGAAARAAYGPHGLLLVTTAAPLRHLHAPDECLTGLGHQVRYVGVDHGHMPSAVYRSVDPQGRTWRVAVTFVSANGELASSVGQVVWHWLQAPQYNWTMVQRISPWESSASAVYAWDQAVAQALDLPQALNAPRVMHLAGRGSDF